MVSTESTALYEALSESCIHQKSQSLYDNMDEEMTKKIQEEDIKQEDIVHIPPIQYTYVTPDSPLDSTKSMGVYKATLPEGHTHQMSQKSYNNVDSPTDSPLHSTESMGPYKATLPEGHTHQMSQNSYNNMDEKEAEVMEEDIKQDVVQYTNVTQDSPLDLKNPELMIDQQTLKQKWNRKRRKRAYKKRKSKKRKMGQTHQMSHSLCENMDEAVTEVMGEEQEENIKQEDIVQVPPKQFTYVTPDIPLDSPTDSPLHSTLDSSQSTGLYKATLQEGPTHQKSLSLFENMDEKVTEVMAKKQEEDIKQEDIKHVPPIENVTQDSPSDSTESTGLYETTLQEGPTHQKSLSLFENMDEKVTEVMAKKQEEDIKQEDIKHIPPIENVTQDSPSDSTESTGLYETTFQEGPTHQKSLSLYSNMDEEVSKLMAETQEDDIYSLPDGYQPSEERKKPELRIDQQPKIGHSRSAKRRQRSKLKKYLYLQQQQGSQVVSFQRQQPQDMVPPSSLPQPQKPGNKLPQSGAKPIIIKSNSPLDSKQSMGPYKAKLPEDHTHQMSQNSYNNMEEKVAEVMEEDIKQDDIQYTYVTPDSPLDSPTDSPLNSTESTGLYEATLQEGPTHQKSLSLCENMDDEVTELMGTKQKEIIKLEYIKPLPPIEYVTPDSSPDSTESMGLYKATLQEGTTHQKSLSLCENMDGEVTELMGTKQEEIIKLEYIKHLPPIENVTPDSPLDSTESTGLYKAGIQEGPTHQKSLSLCENMIEEVTELIGTKQKEIIKQEDIKQEDLKPLPPIENVTQDSPPDSTESTGLYKATLPESCIHQKSESLYSNMDEEVPKLMAEVQEDDIYLLPDGYQPSEERKKPELRIDQQPKIGHSRSARRRHKKRMKYLQQQQGSQVVGFQRQQKQQPVPSHQQPQDMVPPSSLPQPQKPGNKLPQSGAKPIIIKSNSPLDSKQSMGPYKAKLPEDHTHQTSQNSYNNMDEKVAEVMEEDIKQDDVQYTYVTPDSPLDSPTDNPLDSTESTGLYEATLQEGPTHQKSLSLCENMDDEVNELMGTKQKEIIKQEDIKREDLKPLPPIEYVTPDSSPDSTESTGLYEATLQEGPTHQKSLSLCENMDDEVTELMGTKQKEIIKQEDIKQEDIKHLLPIENVTQKSPIDSTESTGLYEATLQEGPTHQKSLSLFENMDEKVTEVMAKKQGEDIKQEDIKHLPPIENVTQDSPPDSTESTGLYKATLPESCIHQKSQSLYSNMDEEVSKLMAEVQEDDIYLLPDGYQPSEERKQQQGSQGVCFQRQQKQQPVPGPKQPPEGHTHQMSQNSYNNVDEKVAELMEEDIKQDVVQYTYVTPDSPLDSPTDSPLDSLPDSTESTGLSKEVADVMVEKQVKDAYSPQEINQEKAGVAMEKCRKAIVEYRKKVQEERCSMENFKDNHLSSSLNSQSKATSTASSQSNATSTASNQSKATSTVRSQSETTFTPSNQSESSSVIDLDVIGNDSLIFVSDDSIHSPVLDLSNNVGPTTRSKTAKKTTATVIDLDVTDKDSHKLLSDNTICSPVHDLSNIARGATTKAKTSKKATAAASKDERRHRCAVLNCEAEFSSEGALGQHLNMFQHSPCNPRLKATDCKLAPDSLFYMCPDCDMEFQNPDDCSAHMKAERHSPYYPPLCVAGYMCAQCLYVFEDYSACWYHIKVSGHRDICNPIAEMLVQIRRQHKNTSTHTRSGKPTVGDKVVSGSRKGTLMYIGPLKSRKGQWAGIRLDEPCGKNDGTYGGERYFECPMKYGLFKKLRTTKLYRDNLVAHVKGPGPVAVIQELVEDLARRCRDLPWNVQCLQCSLEVDDPAALHQHRLKTNNTHLLRTFCDSSLVDVFAGYIAGYSCDKCHRLFNGNLELGAKHDCAKGVVGTIIENNVRTFGNFVKCCALSLIKSLDTGIGKLECIKSLDTREGKRRTGLSHREIKMGKNPSVRARKAFQRKILTVFSSQVGKPLETLTTFSSQKGKPVEVVSSDSDEDCIIVSVSGASNSKSRLQDISANASAETTNRATGNQSTSQGATENESTSQGATGNKSTFQGATGNQSTSQGATGNQSTFQGATGNQSTSQGATGNQSTFQGATGYQSTSQGATGNKSTSQGATGNQSTFQGATGNQSIFQGATGNQSTSQGATGNQSTFQGATGNQSTSQGATGNQSTFQGAPRNQSTFQGATGNQPTFQGATGNQSTFQGATGFQSTSQRAAGNQSTYQRAIGNQSTFQGATRNQSTTKGATGNQLTSQRAIGNQSTFQGATRNQSTTKGATGNQLTSQRATGNQSTSQRATGNQSTFQGATGFQSTSHGATRNQSTTQGATRNQSTTQGATGNQSIFQGATGNQSIFQGATGNQSTFQGAPRNQSTFQGATGNQSTSQKATGNQSTFQGATGVARIQNSQQLQPYVPLHSRDFRSPAYRQMAIKGPVRERSRSPLNDALISVDNLSRMTNIIFLDLDNWPCFFIRLPRALPDRTFCWGFHGGNNKWQEPPHCQAKVYRRMKNNGQFYLNERCGNTKDAADFAIVLTVGKMDTSLPSSVAFTILSGDKGFLEVERLMRKSERRAVVVDPHRDSEESIYNRVTSVSFTKNYVESVKKKP